MTAPTKAQIERALAIVKAHYPEMPASYRGRRYQIALAACTEAADEIASLRARVEGLVAENERLTKAVGSGILGELLNDEETDEFVNFIKFLRSQALKDTPDAE